MSVDFEAIGIAARFDVGIFAPVFPVPLLTRIQQTDRLLKSAHPLGGNGCGNEVMGGNGDANAFMCFPIYIVG
jgi:hypothetical protein